MLHKWFIGSFLDLFLSSDVSHNDNVKLTELFVKSQLFQIPMTAEAGSSRQGQSLPVSNRRNTFVKQMCL